MFKRLKKRQLIKKFSEDILVNGYDLTEEQLADREIILAAVSKLGSFLRRASDELKRDKEVVLAAVTHYGLALTYACDELKNDRDVVLAAVTQSGYALEFACDELRADREVVLAAVTQSGCALEFACNELRADKEVVLTAIRHGVGAYDYVIGSLRDDEDVLKLDREVSLVYVSDRGCRMALLSSAALQNKEIIVKALQNGANPHEVYDRIAIDAETADLICLFQHSEMLCTDAEDVYEKLDKLIRLVHEFNENVRWEEDREEPWIDSDSKMLDLITFYAGNFLILTEEPSLAESASEKVESVMEFQSDMYDYVQHWNDWKHIFEEIRAAADRYRLWEESTDVYTVRDEIKEYVIKWTGQLAEMCYKTSYGEFFGVSAVVTLASEEVSVPVLLSIYGK